MIDGIRNARILVASDNVDDAATVRNALLAEFGLIEVSTRADHDVADFERVLPAVVVLAFKDLGHARQYHLAVMAKSPLASGHPHRTVVLCDKADVLTAFDLCKQGSFDDYVLYWPQAFDGKRLAMSVWIVCRYLAEKRASASPAAEHAAGPAVVPVPDPFPTKASTSTPAAVRPQILVVEDDAFAAKLIVKALAAQPWDVVVAGAADEALALLEKMRPRMVLMDVNLPGMDGLELTWRMKAMPALADIPVVMLTGEARRETLERSRTVGAASFIVKPFTRDGLIAKLAPFMV